MRKPNLNHSNEALLRIAHQEIKIDKYGDEYKVVALRGMHENRTASVAPSVE